PLRDTAPTLERSGFVVFGRPPLARRFHAGGGDDTSNAGGLLIGLDVNDIQSSSIKPSLSAPLAAAVESGGGGSLFSLLATNLPPPSWPHCCRAARSMPLVPPRSP
ncbi:unnamed protein product, partial [Ectocarpus sp. 12 AP-2014]